MPELPEVEVTRLGLEPHVRGARISALVVRQARLRWPLLADLGQRLAGQSILGLERRAKYLLFHTTAGTLIIHLGMSGSLRLLTQEYPPGAHDHVDLVLEQQGQRYWLRFNDPRRFGAMLWQPVGQAILGAPPVLDGLGLEPFDLQCRGAWLYRHTRTHTAAIKPLLLAGRIVVGVGNIYASESLFRAGIDPRRSARRISEPRYETLTQAMRSVLQEAIAAGGSSLRDFVNSQGGTGYFQHAHQVYGRGGQPCLRCQRPIREIRQGQRATWFCSHCQH